MEHADPGLAGWLLLLLAAARPHTLMSLVSLSRPEGVGSGETLAVDQAGQVAHAQLVRPVIRQPGSSRRGPAAATTGRDVAQHADPCGAACACMLLAWASTWRITRVGRSRDSGSNAGTAGACGSRAEECCSAAVASATADADATHVVKMGGS